MQIVVTLDGQNHTIDQIGPAEMVAFERQFKLPATVMEPKPLTDDFGNVQVDADGEPLMKADIYLEWVVFLIWRRLRRSGHIDKDTAFDDDFLDRVDGVKFLEEDEAAPDPSVPAAPRI